MHLYARVREYKARVCVRRGKATVPERSQVACGIRQEHSNIQWYYLRALDTRGATDSSLQNNTCLRRVRSPLSNLFFLSRAMDSTRVTFRGSGTALDLEIILHSGGGLFREISEGRLMDLFCGRLCGFTVREGRWRW